MIRSMTGFGRGETEEGGIHFTVEMKSVNNRFLDFNIRLPRQLMALEAQVRNELKQFMQRGKVDVYVTFERTAGTAGSVQYNKEAAAQYYSALMQMAEDFGIERKISLTALAAYPDVLKTDEAELDLEALWPPLRQAIDEACAGFTAAREREGEFLKNDILDKLALMEEHCAFIKERAPEMVVRYREELKARVQELLGDQRPDETRLLQEVTIYADKVCIDEELVRLASHIEAMRQVLKDEENVGRKMDFLAQEMNRESNTILSKSDDMEVSAHAVELKTGVEKIREQVQNME